MSEICCRYEDSKCYFSDTIPAEKLKNAIKYFKIPNNENVIFLCDNTVFGSAKVGFAICEQGIYWGVDWATDTKRTTLTWQEFSKRNIELVDKKSTLVEEIISTSSSFVTKKKSSLY